MKNDEQRLPFDEVKAFSKRLNNTIRDWAVKRLASNARTLCWTRCVCSHGVHL